MILLLVLLSVVALGRPQVRIINPTSAANLDITLFNDQNFESQRINFDSSDRADSRSVPGRSRDDLFDDIGSFVSRTLGSLGNTDFDSREDQVPRSRTRLRGTTRGSRRGSQGRNLPRGPPMTTARAGLSLEGDFDDEEIEFQNSFSQTIEPVNSFGSNRRRVSSFSAPRTPSPQPINDGATSSRATSTSPLSNVDSGRRPDSYTSLSNHNLPGARQASMASNRPQVPQTTSRRANRDRSRSTVPIVEDVREGPYLDGSYSYRYQTGNGIYKEEQRTPTGPNTFTVTGSYSYMSPDGTMVEVNYVADEFGFRVVNPNGEDPLALRGIQERRRRVRDETETDAKLNSDFRLSGSSRLRGRSSRRRDLRL